MRDGQLVNSGKIAGGRGAECSSDTSHRPKIYGKKGKWRRKEGKLKKGRWKI